MSRRRSTTIIPRSTRTRGPRGRAARRLIGACLLAATALVAPVGIPVSVPLTGSGAAMAQEFHALARVDRAASSLRLDAEEGVLVLALTQAVPWRAFTLDAPRRLILDFREVAWEGSGGDVLARALGVEGEALRAGTFRPGWSRLVLRLPAPLAIETAEMRTDPVTGGASVRIALSAVAEQEFSARVPDAAGGLWALPPRAEVPEPVRRQRGDRPLMVALDPGHGGLDPGAQQGGWNEADLMLSFARDLKEALIREGMKVHLTREDDIFVPLQARVSQARSAGADVFVSLHADALAQGKATGTTIYTLSDTASDRASELLAKRLDRADLLAGVDLEDQDDALAGILMDMVRRETAPRSEMLAGYLVSEIGASDGKLYKKPHLKAGFSVLKAPDIPSVLLELGFMSDERDLRRILSPEWRDSLSGAIVSALKLWAAEDAAKAALIRR
ncbi:N-acetylmuramoyl-L-alanine amidase [Brevirhabdus pacifica]|uniref:N-acetylmuramoyl-L-alanine amidase n=2 Tax=Brevirhabdus pacifica TaxID=1267768 RepID=UPI0009FA8604|nr:N-acetylmuramoyl-L-alanine amidase [Brevirhabdus pacifica]PJJ85148.1 N-acetylmuramoyl-L-alanine amidase [Brevirhabdus pacifica]